MKRHEPLTTGNDKAFEMALESLHNRTLTADEKRVLLEGLRSDKEKRRAYIRAVAFDAMLAAEMPGLALVKKELAPASLKSGGRREVWARRAMEVCTPARVTRMDSTSAVFEGRSLVVDARIEPGLVEVAEGCVEVTFDSGAVVSLFGPASLSLESEFRASLLSGVASARVPKQAKGFLLMTPSSYLGYPGTAFAIKVDVVAGTEVHVLEGSLAATPSVPDGYRFQRIIDENRAVRLGAKGVSDIRFSRSGLPQVPEFRKSESAPAVRFTFDREKWHGSRCDSVTGHKLQLLRHEKPERPLLVNGVAGSALRFDGDGLYGRSDFPGVSGSAPRTVSFWIRLDPWVSVDPLTPNGIVAWGVFAAARKWQVAWNKSFMGGTIGALRIEFGDGHVTGATDLRDGRWHHVAVVYLGGEDADVSTHIRLYVDGGLESVTGRVQQRIATDTVSGESEPMIIGRYLGQWEKREPFYFEGELDELRVYDEALLPSDIVGIMEDDMRGAES